MISVSMKTRLHTKHLIFAVFFQFLHNKRLGIYQRQVMNTLWHRMYVKVSHMTCRVTTKANISRKHIYYKPCIKTIKILRSFSFWKEYSSKYYHFNSKQAFLVVHFLDRALIDLLGPGEGGADFPHPPLLNSENIKGMTTTLRGFMIRPRMFPFSAT